MDREGRLIAGTSTGGTCCKLPGRVGDSPLIGCGCYADAEAGGVSCTGWGEAIMKIVMAKAANRPDRKSTRLNSSHVRISYAVFCLKKKKNKTNSNIPAE